jgi:hypothetical protein
MPKRQQSREKKVKIGGKEIALIKGTGNLLCVWIA